MTEVEISRLLSELSEVAATLNRESDSLNALIERFQHILRQLNVGLEVWLVNPIRRDSRPSGVVETYLGFAKGGDNWELRIRHSTYCGDEGLTEDECALLDASRADRIAALEAFPSILVVLKEKAEEAVQAIQDAKRFIS